MAGSPDRNRRLIAFGIFWYLIAFVPVSNLVPTSTQMADRHFFVPTAGAILATLALVNGYRPSSWHRQWTLYSALIVVTAFFGALSYRRTAVWCGKTTPWNGRPQPDLSLWVDAVDKNPENTTALTFLGQAFRRLKPPEGDQALLHLRRALQLGEANQDRIAGERRLILTNIYEALGDAYLVNIHATRCGDPNFSTRT